MRYIVPQELRTESKLYKGLTMFDVGFIFVAFGIIKGLDGLVYEAVLPVYYVFNAVMALIFLARSPFNPGKRMFFSLYAFLIKDRFVFKDELYPAGAMPVMKNRRSSK